MSLCGHTGDRRQWGEGPALCSGYWQETEEVCRRHTDRDQWPGMGGYSDICAGSRALWSLLLTDLALIMWSLTALETMQLLIFILTKGSMFSVYTVTAPATTMTHWPRLVTGDTPNIVTNTINEPLMCAQMGFKIICKLPTIDWALCSLPVHIFGISLLSLKYWWFCLLKD